jgi:hypothetical protein
MNAPYEADFRFTFDFLSVFFRQTRIRRALATLDASGTTGWEKWWQCERTTALANRAAQHRGIGRRAPSGLSDQWWQASHAREHPAARVVPRAKARGHLRLEGEDRRARALPRPPTHGCLADARPRRHRRRYLGDDWTLDCRDARGLLAPNVEGASRRDRRDRRGSQQSFALVNEVGTASIWERITPCAPTRVVELLL